MRDLPMLVRERSKARDDVLVKRPLIRLRHLLPQLKSAGGEGLSIGGTSENEPLTQLHIVASSPPTGWRQFHSACEKCGLRSRGLDCCAVSRCLESTALPDRTSTARPRNPETARPRTYCAGWSNVPTSITLSRGGGGGTRCGINPMSRPEIRPPMCATLSMNGSE